MPFCEEIKRVLKDSGSFVLTSAGPGCLGFRLERLPLRPGRQTGEKLSPCAGVLLVQPREASNTGGVGDGKAPARERFGQHGLVVWQDRLAQGRQQARVLQPYSESMKGLIRNGYKAKKRPSGHDISTKFQRDNGGAIPPNLLQIANTESNSAYIRKCNERGIKPHPARYPEQLVKFFLDFLTDKGDLVIDPFAGSNVTGAVCDQFGRRWLASEIEARYIEGSAVRFEIGPLFDALVERSRRRRNGLRPGDRGDGRVSILPLGRFFYGDSGAIQRDSHPTQVR